MMKRILCLLLALCLCLCACTAAPDGTTAPAETTLPTETTAPPETPLPAETTVPPETPLPAETTVPPESTEPEVFTPYTITRDGSEQWLYAGPGFCFGAQALVFDQVQFTINAEQTDRDGNLWGETKADHWLCLTEPAIVPVRAAYAPEGVQADERWSTAETEYVTDMLFTAEQNLTNVTLWSMAFEEAGFVRDSALHTIAALDTGSTFLASVVFYGDLTTYGLSFTDKSGEERNYQLSISGRDGSLLCTEYLP